MRFVITLLILFVSIFCGASGSFAQTGVSETRQVYLDKTGNIEYQLNSIDIKWNWVMARPAEDSIAKAQGWYVQMEARRNQLQNDLMQAKIEQLRSYYDDISERYSSDEEKLKSTLA